MSYLGETVGGVSALKACVASSGTMKASSQEEAVKSIPAQGPVVAFAPSL